MNGSARLKVVAMDDREKEILAELHRAIEDLEETKPDIQAKADGPLAWIASPLAMVLRALGSPVQLFGLISILLLVGFLVKTLGKFW